MGQVRQEWEDEDAFGFTYPRSVATFDVTITKEYWGTKRQRDRSLAEDLREQAIVLMTAAQDLDPDRKRAERFRCWLIGTMKKDR